MEIDSGFAESVEVGEDADDATYGFFGAFDVYGVRTEIDGDVEGVFEEAEVFVAGPVEGLDAGGDFNGLFIQMSI